MASSAARIAIATANSIHFLTPEAQDEIVESKGLLEHHLGREVASLLTPLAIILPHYASWCEKPGTRQHAL